MAGAESISVEQHVRSTVVAAVTLAFMLGLQEVKAPFGVIEDLFEVHDLIKRGIPLDCRLVIAMLADSTLITLLFSSSPVSSHLSLAILEDVVPKVISVHVLQQVLDTSFQDEALLKVDQGDALKHDCKLAKGDLLKLGRDM